MTLLLMLTSLVISCDNSPYTIQSELVGTWVNTFNEKHVFASDGQYTTPKGHTIAWSATKRQLKIREEFGEQFEEYDGTYGIDGNKLLRECFVRTSGSGNNGSWTRQTGYIDSTNDGEFHVTGIETIKIDGETFYLSEEWTEKESNEEKREEFLERTGKITWSEDGFTVTDFPKNPHEPLTNEDSKTETVLGCYWKGKDIIVRSVETHEDCGEHVFEKQ